MLSNYPNTHEGGVDFVRAVFESMGGRLPAPPPLRRPGFRDCGYKVESSVEAEMMGFENGCLMDFHMLQPRGPRRWEHPEWAAHIKARVFPFRADLDWEEYKEWVQGGGGDRWFLE